MATAVPRPPPALQSQEADLLLEEEIAAFEAAQAEMAAAAAPHAARPAASATPWQGTQAAALPNAWQSSQAAASARPTNAPVAPGVPQKGKVLSITRSNLFGSLRTVMRVQMERGGERNVQAEEHGNVRVAMDVEEGDTVQLTQTGPTQMEWTKVIAGERAEQAGAERLL